MDTYRTLKIYGHRTTDVEYTVLVDGAPVNTTGEELFAFITNTKFHGGLDVMIDVQVGALSITHVTATYPAKINGVSGTVTMIQPIAEPIAIGDQLLQMPFDIEIKSGQKFNYKHLMFNGPTRFIIHTNITATEGMNIFMGNVLTNEFNSCIIECNPEYEYQHQFNDVHSKEHLDLLKQTIRNCA